MKTNLLRVLTAVGAAASAVATLNLGGFISIMPPDLSVYILGGSAAALAVKEIAVVIGDFVDDGKRNSSFK
jgi:hypothetical protein